MFDIEQMFFLFQSRHRQKLCCPRRELKRPRHKKVFPLYVPDTCRKRQVQTTLETPFFLETKPKNVSRRLPVLPLIRHAQPLQQLQGCKGFDLDKTLNTDSF